MEDSASSSKFHFILSDDWELRGNGSGNVRAIQFDTARRLMDIYENFGIKASFNAEVMQQLKHIEFGAKNRDLEKLAEEWEDCVREMYRRGHDVQLHCHIQWLDAEWLHGAWEVGTNWDMTKHPEDIVSKTLSQCVHYLETLIRPIDPDYKVISFRSGAWALAPSPFTLNLLAENGIVFDMSMVKGVCYETPQVTADFRMMLERTRPYYPDMQDGRYIADSMQPIICLPTVTGYVSGNNELLSRLYGESAIIEDSNFITPSSVAIENAETKLSNWNGMGQSPTIPSPRVTQAVQGTHGHLKIFDLSSLNFSQMLELYEGIQHEFRFEKGPHPILIQNHSKDLGDFNAIEKFAEFIAHNSDVSVITSTQCANNFQSGVYVVRKNSISELTQPSLLKRIVARRDRVKRQVSGSTSTFVPEPPQVKAEEALRKIMVRYFPLASNQAVSHDQFKMIIGLFFLITAKSESKSDWRFFDAWNNFYEVFDKTPQPNDFGLHIDWFLQKYLLILEKQIQNLHSGFASAFSKGSS